MTITLILFGIFMLASFTAGFYFGYLKREDKPPELPEIFKSVKRYTRKVKDTEVEPKSFYD